MNSPFVEIEIAAGMRISARVQSSVASEPAVGVTVYGAY
jgi:hypothetical protein